MCRYNMLKLYLVIQFTLFNVLSFNFDINYPIIYEDPYKTMNIERDLTSYFGYSVVLYSGDERTKSWIQIGAPRGSDLNIPAYNPGTVFKCEIWRQCKMIDIDTDYGRGIYNGIPYIAKKDQAWTGNVMDINTEFNRIIVCAYRWTNHLERRKEYCPEGACYWSKINETKYEKLLPLIDPAKYAVSFQRTLFLNYAMGEAGFSAHLTHSKHGPELLLGAPNVFNWKGTSMIYKTLYKNDTFDYTIPSLNIAKSEIIQNFDSNQQLFGYAVTSGYYFNENELLYITSAPKHNYLGAILVYNFRSRTEMGLDVVQQIYGKQFGEYFGASLASGDIDTDGYYDLLVGAPFHKKSKYNEGRVYIFFGSRTRSLQIPENTPYLIGKAVGGQFGLSVAYLGDIDIDGYGDIAVAAPYENEKSGVVYIYRGSTNGIIGEPSQIIAGKDIDINLKGFGYSFSKTADIDNNKYEDLAIGSYLSGHTIIFRASPIVALKQSIKLLNNNIIYLENKSIDVEICLWYEGNFLPSTISVTRTITIDEILQRATLDPQFKPALDVYLRQEKLECSIYSVHVKENITNLVDPIVVKVSQELIEEKRPKKPIYIGVGNEDGFCKTCPVLRSYEASEEEILFSLGCGNDNICKSNLLFDATFSNVKDNSIYVLGSEDYIIISINVVNTGEKAYFTRIVVELPKNVEFRNIPRPCTEFNSSTIICPVDNPIQSNTMKTISLPINMYRINRGKSGKDISFKVTVHTSSENLNKIHTKQFKLYLRTEADVKLTGVSDQETYLYGNLTTGNRIEFSQIYQMQKLGKSPIGEVEFNLHIPTSIISNDKRITFVKLQSHIGVLAGQPITCKNITHIDYVLKEITEPDDIHKNNDKIPEARSFNFNVDDRSKMLYNSGYLIDGTKLLRKRSIDTSIVYTNNLNETLNDTNLNDTNLELIEQSVWDKLDLPMNRTHAIDCDTSGVYCAIIRCRAGPFTNVQQMAVVQIKAFIDVTSLKDILGKKDIVVFGTVANISFGDSSRSGDMITRISRVVTVFLAEIPKAEIKTWIVILAIVCGILLLLLLISGLIKAGFFKREKKMELEALKEAEAVEQFEKNARLSTEHKEITNEELLDIDNISFSNSILQKDDTPDDMLPTGEEIDGSKS